MALHGNNNVRRNKRTDLYHNTMNIKLQNSYLIMKLSAMSKILQPPLPRSSPVFYTCEVEVLNFTNVSPNTSLLLRNFLQILLISRYLIYYQKIIKESNIMQPFKVAILLK